eukprot:COSAG02_NODE_494_length_21161_cov_48.367534_5_plen_184_part_00
MCSPWHTEHETRSHVSPAAAQCLQRQGCPICLDVWRCFLIGGSTAPPLAPPLAPLLAPLLALPLAPPLAPSLIPPWASAGGPIQPADLREVCFVRDRVRTPTSPPPCPVTNEARLAKAWEWRRSSALRQLTLVSGAAPRGSGPSKGSTVTWCQRSTDAIAPSCHMRAAAAQPRLSSPRCVIPR